jgi:hypothetical protein
VDLKKQFRISRRKIALRPEAVERVEHPAAGQPNLAPQRLAAAGLR